MKAESEAAAAFPIAGKTSSGTAALLGWLIVLGPAAYFLIFELPWNVAVKGPMASESYTFGFSNITAHLGLAVTLAALFGIRLFLPTIAAGDRELLTGLIGTPAPRSRTTVVTTLLCIAVSFAVVAGWWHVLPFGYFGESTYFLTRLDRMTLGQTPFHDFDYGYGPAMLWLPFLIHQLMGGLFAMDTVYIGTVLLHFALGILAFDYIARCLRLSDAYRAALVAFVSIAFLNITLGVIYTPLRFVYALWAALFLHHTLRTASPVKSWLAALLIPFTGLLLSPDTGLVTCVASAAGVLWYLRDGDRALASRAIAVMAAIPLTMAVFGTDYFKMILFFGGGAFNFPILPAPYILSIVVAACWLLPRISTAAWTSRDTSAPLWVSMLFTLGLFLPSALGRCDPGHVLLNGIGILFISMAAAFYETAGWAKFVAVIPALTIYGTTQISFWNHYDVIIKDALSTRTVLADNREKFNQSETLVRSRLDQELKHSRFDWAKRVPFTADLLDLLRYPSIATPLGVSEDLDRFLKASGRYFPEFFVPPLGGTFTPETVDRKLAEYKDVDLLLVPQSALRHLQKVDLASYGKGWSEFMEKLFVFPVDLRVVHPPYLPEAVIIQRFAAEFNVEARFRDYLILRRKPAPPRP